MRYIFNKPWVFLGAEMFDEFTGFGEVDQPFIVPIPNHNIPFVRKGYIVNISQLTFQSTVAAKFSEKGAIGIKYLNPVIVVISYKDFKLR